MRFTARARYTGDMSDRGSPEAEALRERLHAILDRLATDYGVRSLALFGSRARGEAVPDSDLDLLVEFDSERRLSLFDFVRLENELSDWVGVRVDLVERRALKPVIGRRILQDIIPV